MQEKYWNIKSIGNEARKSFIQKRLKKSKIQNFATESRKLKILQTEGKIIKATLIRDLFGSILFLSMQQKKIWLKFENTHLHMSCFA